MGALGLTDEPVAFQETFGDLPHRGQGLVPRSRSFQFRMKRAVVCDGNLIPVIRLFRWSKHEETKQVKHEALLLEYLSINSHINVNQGWLLFREYSAGLITSSEVSAKRLKLTSLVARYLGSAKYLLGFYHQGVRAPL
jgi:hypothetical protein